MHVDFGTILFLVAAYVSVTEVHSAGSNTTCFGSSNVARGGHFHAFELVQRSNEHVYGCASSDKPLFEVHGNTSSYGENHVIDIKSNGAADIYLNIKGIHHRTTNSLPQYDEYKYKFALLSEKDVIWLVSLENMPKSSVSYQIWISIGSQVIFRDDKKYPVVESNFDRKYMSAQALLKMYKTNIFQEQELTSFSQISTNRVAAVNISVGPKHGPTKTWNGNFTSRCDTVEEYYRSPIVSIEKYEASLPTCQRDASSQMEPGLGKAYIVDVRMDDSIDSGKRKIVYLETVISEASGDNDPTAGKTIVVLRSDAFTLWRVNIARASRELRYPDIKFVIGTKDEIDVVWGAEIVKENLDYDRNDRTALTSSIETRYRCVVVSYVEYDSPTDLIILSLSESKDQGDGSNVDPDTLTDKALDIYQQSKVTCEKDNWELVIPYEVLDQYELSMEDEAEDIKIGTDSSPCMLKQEFMPGFPLIYNLMQCSSTDDEGNHESELSVTFRTRGKHLFPSLEPVRETVSIPLRCQKKRQPVVNQPRTPDVRLPEKNETQNVIARCEDDVFFVEIPDKDTQHLNLTAIAKCSTTHVNGYTEYKFHLTPDHAECKSHFKDGIFRIAIPTKSSGDVNVSSEPLELTCEDKNVDVTTKYNLRVYEDFNLRNLLSRGPIRVPIQPNQQDSDETTYHVQVSLHSNDPLLMVYLSHCYLKQETRIILELIKNNCPATNFVSFVRPMLPSGNNAQHFTVKMASFFPKYADGLLIECDVSACTTEPCDDCVLSSPQCLNLHGDSCTQDDLTLLVLSPSHKNTLKSKIFLPATKNIERVTQVTNEVRKTEVNGDPPNDGDSVGIPIVVILALGAFALGCIFVCLMWFIDRQYHSKHENHRKTTKSESDGSRESNSSRSTSSTKTTGSSFSSLFCLKTEKSSSSSSPTSSKDDLEMRPFIKSSSTSIKQPQNNEVRSKITTDSKKDTNPTSCRPNGDSKSSILNSSHAEGPMFCGKTITISVPTPDASRHSQAAKQPPPLSASADETPGFVDAVIHIPHEESPLWQTSSKQDHLPFTDAASLTHEKTNGTSRQPRRPLTSQRTEPVSHEGWRLNSCPVRLTQDKFASLKEVTL